MNNIQEKDLLPLSYWEKIKKLALNFAISNDHDLLLAITIPVFGESHYIEKTLNNLSVFQKDNAPKISFIIPVVKKITPKDKTLGIIKSFINKHPKELIFPVEEETFPGKTCIGHARAIGFGLAIWLAKQKQVPLSNLILCSTDADILEIDHHYLNKVRQAFLNRSTHVVSCENRFTKKAMECDYIRLLKVIDDGFFFNQFETIGALNGRCYSIRADKYLSSEGVDHTAQFDDISFGIKVHKKVGKKAFHWIRSYVVSSERRYAKTIKKESLMSGYQDSTPLGVQEFEYFKNIPLKIKKRFYLDHVNEGFNVLLYYYAKRFSYEKSRESNFLSQFHKYFKYINDNLPFVEVKDLNERKTINLYRKYSAGKASSEWWRERISFEIDLT